ncbi:hypothetical protein L6164_006255 [Bauhinia variegata]|uniref:Uncharacterized protein n=1 Tax=Bauhinia variegata TaxID=167791 RepID=A0ACB9PT96_BAUVA|nr:hypothetical protein L6164_006255 [Bauhinia variegata]
MMKKLLLTTRGGHAFWSNYKQSHTRWSLSGPPNWVSIKINKSVGQSNIQRRGWSGAASVPSDKPNNMKSRKRVSREERRSMVESYVKKYREMNAGKFPAISDTVKQVGGSYYVVRKIVQELEYKSKMSSSNIMNDNLAETELFNKSKPLTEAVTVSSGKTEATTDGHVQNDPQLVDLDDKEIVNAGYEDRRIPHSSRSLSDEDVHMERDTEEPSQSGLKISNEVKARSDMLAEELEHIPTPFSDKSGDSHGKSQSRNYEFADVENHPVIDNNFIEKAEYERRDQAALEGLPGTDGPKHKMEHSQGSSVLDENKSDKSNNEATNLVAPKKSTFLGSLKSFADGFVNFWRNL